MREYTQEELKEKLKTAYNVEARAGHKKDHLSINLIGTVKRGSRLYDLYEDTGNSYWYSLRFITDHGIVSEYEYIFGHPERKPEKKRGQKMEHDRIAEKLKKIKALADRGVGGEKETAMRMYEELKARYEIKDEEIMLDTVSLHWFGYNGELEEDLLTQIFYKVTGSASYHVYTGKYKRRKKRGCDCTEIEAAEIKLLFSFYKEELKRELRTFMITFRSGNNLYPDETARCYIENDNIPEREKTAEEKRELKKAAFYRMLLDKREPPRAMIGEDQEDEE